MLVKSAAFRNVVVSVDFRIRELQLHNLLKFITEIAFYGLVDPFIHSTINRSYETACNIYVNLCLND